MADGGSGDDAADLEIHDGVPVDADALEDGVAVLVELGRPPRLRRLLTELNQTLDQNSGNIDDLLENIRMTTENLRTLTETLMHSPASLIRGIRVPDRKPGDVRQ